MKAYDISQLPVVDGEDRLVGMISEVDLLDHLLHADHIHDPEETIKPMVNPNVITVQPEASVESVLPAFERGRVVVVTEGEAPIAMLTKIDLIDYLAGQMG
jgi:cystathionine beta-synthase